MVKYSVLLFNKKMRLFDFLRKVKYIIELDEIASLVFILESLAKSDGLYDEYEEKKILEILKLIGEKRWNKSVWEQLQFKIKNTNNEKSLDVLKKLSHNKKLEVTAFMDIVSKADENISSQEQLFINSVKLALLIIRFQMKI